MVATWLGGCGLLGRAPRPEVATTQHGIASWYGPGFHGNATSSGEIYDQYGLTAAHQRLPLGTRVRVINVRNQRSVTVRINDRGPFVDDRVIDLSYAAARTLDMIGPGTTPVRIEVVGATGPALPAVRYAVQVGAFTSRERASHLRSALQRRFERVYVATASTSGRPEYYRVRVGPFAAREEAARAAQRVGQLGWPAVVVEDGVVQH